MKRGVQFVLCGVLLGLCLSCMVNRGTTQGAYATQIYSPAYYSSPTYTAGAGLVVGQAVQGFLDYSDTPLGDGRVVDAYRFYGQAGQHVTIMMRSPTLDTYLAVFYGRSSRILFSDDDSAGNYDSMIQAYLPYTGEYLIACTTAPPAIAVNGLRTGPYVLSINP